jgi:hypothetical protein
MHTWQMVVSGYAANGTLPEYFGKMHAGLDVVGATIFSLKTGE